MSRKPERETTTRLQIALRATRPAPTGAARGTPPGPDAVAARNQGPAGSDASAPPGNRPPGGPRDPVAVSADPAPRVDPPWRLPEHCSRGAIGLARPANLASPIGSSLVQISRLRNDQGGL
jgi:hypothetical protein